MPYVLQKSVLIFTSQLVYLSLLQILTNPLFITDKDSIFSSSIIYVQFIVLPHHIESTDLQTQTSMVPHFTKTVGIQIKKEG
ncbi:hypothetical protein [Evansella cellulosilytica]|uniref:hypothetical protein n=1 Tax=Evansella cellulosilytica TaxID=1413 RepID=UPI0005A02C1C|nr:hypothetical protein [Evansella cellulosilytica]